MAQQQQIQRKKSTVRQMDFHEGEITEVLESARKAVKRARNAVLTAQAFIDRTDREYAS